MRLIIFFLTILMLTGCEEGFQSLKSQGSSGSLTNPGNNSNPGLTCKVDEHAEGGVCVSNVRACAVTNGAGTETYDGQKYGACIAKTCDATYHVENNLCASDMRVCKIENGSGIETYDGLKYGACTLKTCDKDYHAEGNVCAANVRACDIPNGKGTQTYDGQKFGACMVVTCNSDYQKTGNSCNRSLVGKFRSPCGTGSNGIDNYFINDFMDDTKQMITNYYFFNPGTEGSCSIPIYTTRAVGTYARVAPSVVDPGAVLIDFTQPKIEFVALSDDMVAVFNQIQQCGFAGWTKNVVYTFTKAECGAKDVIKSINKVVGDKLYVGDFTGQLDAEGRPLRTSLDPARISNRIP